MSFRTRLNNGINAAVKTASNLGAAPFVADWRWREFNGISDGSIQASIHNPNIRIEYAKRAVWVYACVQSRSNVIKDIPLKLYRRKDNGVREEVHGHPAGELMLDVNPVKDTPASIRTATEQGLCIHGRYTWVKVRNNAGIVKELYGLPQQAVKIEPKGTWIGSFTYEYRDGNYKKQEVYDVNDVVYFRYPDPDGSPEGFSPLMVAIETTQADLGVLQGQNAMIMNSGRPSVVITMPNKLNDSDYARENERVQRTFAGAVNAGKIWLIDNAADTKIQPIQLSPRDLEWITQHKSYIKDICASFGVTPGMVGEFAEASRLANAGAMHRFYGETFVRPELQLWEDTINWQLLWTEDWGHGVGWEREQGMYFEHDLSQVSMFREDESAMSIRAKESMQAAASLDQVLEMQGLPPIGGEQGSMRFVPSNFVPLSSFVKTTNSVDSQEIESTIEHTAEMGQEYQKRGRENNQASSAFTDAKQKNDMEYAKAKEKQQFRKWAKKHNLKSESFEFSFLEEEEQNELIESMMPKSNLNDEIKSVLSKLEEALRQPQPQTGQPMVLNFPQLTGFTNEIKTEPPTVIVNPTPINVEVNPTPVTVNVEQAQVNVEVNPTPIKVDVKPTPINVEAPIVNVAQPKITVENNVTPAPVTIKETKEPNKTVKVKRDKDGKMSELEVTNE